jgi:hypothetical protein
VPVSSPASSPPPLDDTEPETLPSFEESQNDYYGNQLEFAPSKNSPTSSNEAEPGDETQTFSQQGSPEWSELRVDDSPGGSLSDMNPFDDANTAAK